MGVQVFQLSPAGSELNINGDGAGDWLDYSLFTGAVLVDLTSGSATGVDGGAGGSITNIANVRGGGNNTLTGNGGNILIGGRGTNVLTDAFIGTGASGRRLLIGGSGPSMIASGSPGGIMIGVTTNHDTNYAVLAAILAEWESSDDYNTRFERLESLESGGLSGSRRSAPTVVWRRGGIQPHIRRLAGPLASTIAT
jgi:hypothetical protein